MPNEVLDEDNNSNVSLTSLNLMITLAFFGMIWSIVSYILFIRWKCINDQNLRESQLLPIVKPIWDTYCYPFLYTCCCALCIQNPKHKLEKTPINGVECKPSQQSATPVHGAYNNYQSVSSVNGANEHQSISRANSWLTVI